MRYDFRSYTILSDLCQTSAQVLDPRVLEYIRDLLAQNNEISVGVQPSYMMRAFRLGYALEIAIVHIV